MGTKTPSSIDYDALLRELALEKWHRSIVEGNVHQAETHARSLSSSQEKLWRFLGWNKLAVTYFASGQQGRAFDALDAAIRTFGRSRPLSLLPLMTTAHAHIELAAFDSAAEALEGRAAQSPEARYFGALANALSGNVDVARALTEPMTRSQRPLIVAFALHIRSVLDDDPSTLETASRMVSQMALEAPEPVFPIRFANAESLHRRERFDLALEELEQLTEAKGARAHWPIPYARSWFYRGTSLRNLGREQEAKASFQSFLDPWEHGDIDRRLVADARQFVNA